jgi:alginate O-acetyltransferase complex protein AlgI
VAVPRLYLNLMIVFLISGLWHGANWTFIVWGAINGLYLIIASIIKQPKEKLHKATGLAYVQWIYSFIQILTTFILISFSWIFFRADSIQSAFTVIKKIFGSLGHLYIQENIFYVLLGSGLLFLSEFVSEYYPHKKLFTKSSYAVVRCLSYSFIVIIILAFGVFDGGQFIYFQF